MTDQTQWLSLRPAAIADIVLDNDIAILDEDVRSYYTAKKLGGAHDVLPLADLLANSAARVIQNYKTKRDGDR